MRRAVLCAALSATLWSSDVGAQSVTLTEADAIARLSADSPRARAIRAGVDVAHADVLGVGRWPNPRLNVDREAVAGISETLDNRAAAAANHRTTHVGTGVGTCAGRRDRTSCGR